MKFKSQKIILTFLLRKYKFKPSELINSFPFLKWKLFILSLYKTTLSRLFRTKLRTLSKTRTKIRVCVHFQAQTARHANTKETWMRFQWYWNKDNRRWSQRNLQATKFTVIRSTLIIWSKSAHLSSSRIPSIRRPCTSEHPHTWKKSSTIKPSKTVTEYFKSTAKMSELIIWWAVLTKKFKKSKCPLKIFLWSFSWTLNMWTLCLPEEPASTGLANLRKLWKILTTHWNWTPKNQDLRNPTFSREDLVTPNSTLENSQRKIWLRKTKINCLQSSLTPVQLEEWRKCQIWSRGILQITVFKRSVL